MIKISIIIPTCDRPDLLKRAVGSAQNQMTPPDEIIIVDDGKDASPYIDGTRLVRTGGLEGPARARNMGVKASVSDAFCYLDDDDELLPNYVETQSRLIGEGHDFAFSTALFRYQNGHETTDPEPENKGPKRYYDPAALLEQNIAPISSFIHTRRAFDAVGGWDESLEKLEDWDFWGRMFIAFGAPGKSSETTNVIYRGHGVTRGGGNAYAYSMSCSWRDLVDDRLQKLSKERRAQLEEDDKVTVPLLSTVVLEPPIGLPEGCEIIFLTNNFDTPLRDNPHVRMFPRAEGDVVALNAGIMYSRSRYVFLGSKEGFGDIAAGVSVLEGDKRMPLTGRPTGFIARRKLFEMTNGLDEKLNLEQAMYDFWEKANRTGH